MLKRILGDGFRTFFLLAALWAILAVIIWEIWLAVQVFGGTPLLQDLSMAPHQWHGHEMIFGYGAAAVAGFLLTAVSKEQRGFIAIAALLWVAGRVAFWWSASLSPWLVAGLDLAFLPFLSGQLLIRVLRRYNPQHFVFLLFVAALTMGNVLSHLGLLGHVPDGFETGQRLGLFALCSLIAILGGRVCPGFVKNAMKRAGCPEISWPQITPRLDRVVLVLALSLPWLSPWGAIAAPVAMALGVGIAARVLRWHPLWTRHEPLLWSLITAQSALAVGLILWALAHWQFAGTEVGALHVLGLGAVGGMTMAVMSRATLAHSGRPLKVPGPVAVGYGAIIGAALIRWAGTVLFAEWYFSLILLSGALWVFAFAMFLLYFGGALTGPRLPKPPVSPPPVMPGE